MGWDELGDCSNDSFFFLRFGDDDVRVWGVSSSFASKFEDWIWCFFIERSIYGSPTASVLGSFFVKDTKPVSCRCRSFQHKSILLLMSTPPLQMLEVKIDCD